MTLIEELKKEKLFLYIIGVVIGFVLTIGSTIYIPNTFVGEAGLKQIVNFLELSLCGEAILCIFSVLMGYEIITSLGNRSFKNKIVKWIILIFIMITALDKCPSLFRNYNSHIGNDNFFGICFFEDLKMLYDCKKDLKESEFNTLYDVSYDVKQRRIPRSRYSPRHIETYLYLYKYKKNNNVDFIDYTCVKLEDYNRIEEKFNGGTISEIKLYKNTNFIYSIK